MYKYTKKKYLILNLLILIYQYYNVIYQNIKFKYNNIICNSNSNSNIWIIIFKTKKVT
jgi:hypothetical protein